MPLDRHDVMLLLAQLAEEEELRVTVKGSAFGSLLAAVGAFIGGVSLGPPGLLIGETTVERDLTSVLTHCRQNWPHCRQNWPLCRPIRLHDRRVCGIWPLALCLVLWSFR